MADEDERGGTDVTVDWRKEYFASLKHAMRDVKFTYHDGDSDHVKEWLARKPEPPVASVWSGQPVRYRPHRRLLADSIAETVNIKDRADLVAYLQKERDYMLFDPSDVTVEKYGTGIDERCGWDTHIVCIKGRAVGFTDGMV